MPDRSSRSARPNRATSAAALLQRGLAAHQAGRLAEARADYQQALALEPRNAAANHLLGLIHLAQHDPAMAVTLISRATAADPRNHQYLGNLGVALNAAGRPAEALAALDRAIALKPDFADAHSNRGMVLRTLGRLEQAVTAYGEAIRLRPEEAGFHFNLGNTLEDTGDFHEAAASYGRAAELRPRHARALAGLARMLLRSARSDDALAAARQAVEANARESDAVTALAAVHRSRGELDEAARVFDRLIAAEPGNANALFDRAMLRVHDVRDESFARMEQVLRDPARPTEARARAGFALGKALADIEQHSESRSVFDEANALMRTEVRIEEGAIAHMQRLAEDFERVPPALNDAGYRDVAPIFVVGLPRSGKTTVERLLAQAGGVVGLGELPRFSRLVSALGAGGAFPPQSSLSPTALTGLGRAYADYGRSLSGDAATWIDTMPPNFNLVGYIRLALPAARIVWCVRDPLDHCVALYEKLFGKGGHGFTYDIEPLAAHYRAHRQLGNAWQRLWPDSVLSLDTTELSTDAESRQRLFSFCDLEAPLHSAVEESEPELGAPSLAESTTRRAAHLKAYGHDLGALLSAQAIKPSESSPPGDNR